LEAALIDEVQKFLLELGSGFSFVEGTMAAALILKLSGLG